MPKVPFDDTNKKQGSTFPKLKLDTGERARIAVFTDPEAAYVHTLRAPKLVNGKPVMETKTRRDKTTYQDYVMDFIGNPLCLGDFDILEDRGVDATNCPACKSSKESDAILPPKRRFAMPVIRYVNLKNGSFELATPFAVKIEVWAFTDERFNKVVEIKNEWSDTGGLAGHDLNLGPCSDKNFQKYDINPSNRAEWQLDQARKQMVKDAIESQVPDDLLEACGRSIAKKYVEEDVERVLSRWRQVNGESPTSDPLKAVEASSMKDSFDAALSNLDNGKEESSPVLADDSDGAFDLDSFMSTLND